VIQSSNHLYGRRQRLFWHFYTKFRLLPPFRSIAEARISTSELEFLKQWFAEQYGKPKNWCDRTWQEKVDEDVTASSREMFGALFLIAASLVRPGSYVTTSTTRGGQPPARSSKRRRTARGRGDHQSRRGHPSPPTSESWFIEFLPSRPLTPASWGERSRQH